MKKITHIATRLRRHASEGRRAGRLCMVVALFLGAAVGVVSAQSRKVQNLPYADFKLLHLGFSIGTHVQDMTFVHSGFVTESGESWYMDMFRGLGGSEPLPLSKADLSADDSAAVSGASVTFNGIASALSAGSDYVKGLGGAV